MYTLCTGEVGPDTPWSSAWGDRQTGGKAPELRATAVLRGWTMGWGELWLTFFCSELGRGKGGTHGACDRAAGNRAASWYGGWAVSAAVVNHGGQGAGLVSFGQGGSDHPCSEGGSWKEGGGHEAGGGDEEGEEGTMDGVFVGARVGKERQLPYSCLICGWATWWIASFALYLTNLCSLHHLHSASLHRLYSASLHQVLILFLLSILPQSCDNISSCFSLINVWRRIILDTV